MAKLTFGMSNGDRWTVDGTYGELQAVVTKITGDGAIKPDWIKVTNVLTIQREHISSLKIKDV